MPLSLSVPPHCGDPLPAAAAACLSLSELRSPPLTPSHQHFPCPQVSCPAQNCSPAEIPHLFGSRGSAVTLSEHKGNVCIARNGLPSCLTWGKCPFQSSTQMLGMRVPIRALQDGTEQLCSVIPKREVCYNPSCLQRCSSCRQRS